jgi:hypothetical protein
MLITKKETGALISVSEKTVQRLIDTRKIKANKINPRILRINTNQTFFKKLGLNNKDIHTQITLQRQVNKESKEK